MSVIEITEIQIQAVGPESLPLIGFCRVTLNGAFVIKGIRIVRGKEGVFISFPREYNARTKEANSICFPIRKELTDAMTSQILKAYEEKIK